MRILNEQNEEIFDYDRELGYLNSERIFKCHHEAVEEVPEQGHEEVIAEYPNGGKDVKWVVDVEGIKAKEAWDEYEDIYRYVPFNQNELNERRYLSLKSKLAQTDYCVIKIAEGAATVEEYADIIDQRQQWRQEVNQLEVIINFGNESD